MLHTLHTAGNACDIFVDALRFGSFVCGGALPWFARTRAVVEMGRRNRLFSLNSGKG